MLKKTENTGFILKTGNSQPKAGYTGKKNNRSGMIRYIVLIQLYILLAFQFQPGFAQAPAGYYDAAANLTGNDLQMALYNIIKDHTVISYNDIWTAFATTDTIQPGNICWDMYSYTTTATPPYIFYIPAGQCATTPGYEGGCYNREHSFPKSWFGGEVSPMYTDLFHIIPTDSYVNTRRNNYPYGEVSSPTWPSLNGGKLGPCSFPGYTGTVFEPIDEYKGDLARNYFYMVTRYANIVAGWESNDTYGDAVLDGTQYPAFESWAITMLLQWHLEDPVSQKEINRNNAVYAIQHNRNPFIDHPEYAGRIWPQFMPVSSEPTAYPTEFSAHNITLHWDDPVSGTLPTGYLIEWSIVGFDQITDPVDGVFVSDGDSALNVAYGVGTALIKNLVPGTEYYFKLYAYTGEGASVNYKVDAEVPQVARKTND